MAGKDIKGLIVEETGDSLKLINNPSAPDKITVVLKSGIEERTPSEVSIMPKGVLNKLPATRPLFAGGYDGWRR
jgi:hypothetical protein